MIPKILHYVWLGNNKSDLINTCISSMKKHLKDYRIIEWNENNINIDEFDDTLKKYYVHYYKIKKYAFCAAIARLHILKKYGGVFVDADVEFIKDIPKEMLNTPFVSVDRANKWIEPNCVWGCYKEDRLVNSLIRWLSNSMKTCGDYYGKKWDFSMLMAEFFIMLGCDISSKCNTKFFDYTVYSDKYFCPKIEGQDDIKITDDTISIHHFCGTWRK
jgi:mannosyltransferase OCH1-like enzyme